MKKGFGHWLVKETTRGFTVALIGGKLQGKNISKLEDVIFPTLDDVKTFCKGPITIVKRTVKVTKNSIINK